MTTTEEDDLLSTTAGDTDVSDRLRDLELTMARFGGTIETKLDGISAELRSGATRFEEHERRLRLLETTLTGLSVKVGLLGSGAGAVAGIAAAVITKLIGA